MEIIRNILSDLELTEINRNDCFSEKDIYDLIIENCGYDKIADSLSFFYLKLAAAAISVEIFKQEFYSTPTFDEDYIIELLNDRDEFEYHSLYEYHFGKQKYLEYHTINKKTFFFGENLKLEYDILIKMFAISITADLNLALEKLKRNLTQNIDLKSWCDLLLGGYEQDYLPFEKERINEIITDILD
jgi:hypothetical protein